MPLSLSKTQAVADLAEHIADFLPGKPHPFADPAISFPGVAARLRLDKFWGQGSKVPAVTQLLALTLEREPGQFCTLVLEVLRRGIPYRQRKSPITKSEVKVLDQLVRRCGFGIKDLAEPAFLESLPERQSSSMPAQNRRPEGVAPRATDLAAFKARLDDLAEMAPVNRGFAFERFLGELFEAYGLAPRSSFRLVGEQIDGSFDLSGLTYLVEAKWQAGKVSQADLLVFHGKIGGKAQWSRGLLISYSGFSEDGLEAFARGKQTNLLCMNRSDLYFVLAGRGSLPEVIARKARRAAEENVAFVQADRLYSV
jgi:hypothetical protein